MARKIRGKQHIPMSRPRQRDGDVQPDPTRARCEHDDAVTQEDGLFNIMGDEQDRRLLHRQRLGQPELEFGSGQ